MAVDAATVEKLRKAGVPVHVMSDDLVKSAGTLNEHELKTLVEIRRKLDSGLNEKLRNVADGVGVVVW